MKRILLAACAVLALMGVAQARRANDVLSSNIIGNQLWCYFAHEDLTVIYVHKASCPEEKSLTVSQTGFQYGGTGPEACKFISVKRMPTDERRDFAYAMRAECAATGCDSPPVEYFTLHWVYQGQDSELRIEGKNETHLPETLSSLADPMRPTPRPAIPDTYVHPPTRPWPTQ